MVEYHEESFQSYKRGNRVGQAHTYRHNWLSQSLATHQLSSPSGVGISVVAADRTELMYMTMRDISASNTVTRASSSTDVSITFVQIDNQTTHGPQVLLPMCVNVYGNV